MRLKDARQKAGMTQEQLSKASGISRITIARIEATGKYGTLRVVNKIAQALHIPIGVLLEESKKEAV